MAVTQQALADEFTQARSHLMAVAYRLTGSVADSEDAISEAWLRLAAQSQDKRDAIEDLRGWLVTVVGRICLDRLRSATVRRERYTGDWLPEPIVTPFGAASEDPLDVVVRDDGVRMAALVVLDKLTPEQRVAFVLHDAFGVPFAEIAEILGCSTEAARQHGSRGRRALAEADPPPRASLDEQQDMLQRLLVALGSGNVRAVAEVLHPDVVLVGDSDGKARTTLRTMVGADKITRFFLGLLRRYRPEAFALARPTLVNGDFGLYVPSCPGGDGYLDLDERVQTVAMRDGKIVAIYDIVNPDKLRHVSAGHPA